MTKCPSVSTGNVIVAGHFLHVSGLNDVPRELLPLKAARAAAGFFRSRRRTEVDFAPLFFGPVKKYFAPGGQTRTKNFGDKIGVLLSL